MKVWAVYHERGVSLFKASSAENALQKAMAYFGTDGRPYSVPEDQKQVVAWAKSFGAAIL
jgi:hypothetical protein